MGIKIEKEEAKRYKSSSSRKMVETKGLAEYMCFFIFLDSIWARESRK